MTPNAQQRRTWLSLGLGTAGLLALTGCAGLRNITGQSEAFWSGRLSLQLDSTPPKNWNTSFELQGSAQAGQMTLLSPIGTTLARLSWNLETATLVQGNTQIESRSLERLSTQMAGTPLPIAALFQWLAGQEAHAPGWEVDLTGHAQGQLTAQRHSPLPEARLRILLDR